MKILVVNPNTTATMTRAIEEVANAVAAPGTTVECVNPVAGPASIEGHADEVLAAYHTLELVASSRGSFDGYVIACFGDPAVAACREVVEAPVVGIAEASFQVASLIAHRWSIVTVLDRAKPFLTDVVRMAGVESRCASIRCTEMSVLEIEQDLDRTLDRVEEAARLALAEDSAEAILLGCAGFGPIEKNLSARLGVPVLDGTSCAVKLIETIIGCGYRTSRAAAYRRPEAKVVTGCGAGIQRLYQSSIGLDQAEA